MSIIPDVSLELSNLQQHLESLKVPPPPLVLESYLSCHVIRPTTAAKENMVKQTLVVEEIKRPVVLKSALM